MGQPAVLVTGASSGIGEAVARRLSGGRARVFAGVRTMADADRLRGTNLEPVLLDVTDEEQIARAIDQIEEQVGGAGLAGVVNNAGVARGGPLEFLALDEWRDQFEVNVIGQIAVTRAALPLIRAGRGRIVFVGSISGWVGTEFMGPYCASKFAIEGVAESLRHELAPWKLRVAMVEPGAIRTPIWDKGRVEMERLQRDLPPLALERYADAIARVCVGIEEAEEEGIEPDRVAAAVVHALFSARPRHRYLVGREAKVFALLDRVLPARLKYAVVAKLAGP